LVAHVAKVFSDESSCEVEFSLRNIKDVLVPNSIDNGTVEMNDVRLILPPPCYL